jgi:hypothetical protein
MLQLFFQPGIALLQLDNELLLLGNELISGVGTLQYSLLDQVRIRLSSLSISYTALTQAISPLVGRERLPANSNDPDDRRGRARRVAGQSQQPLQPMSPSASAAIV